MIVGVDALGPPTLGAREGRGDAPLFDGKELESSEVSFAVFVPFVSEPGCRVEVSREGREEEDGARVVVIVGCG